LSEKIQLKIKENHKRKRLYYTNTWMDAA